MTDCEHEWKVIYTDDDGCQKCGAYRLWPGGEIVPPGWTFIRDADGTRIVRKPLGLRPGL